VRKVGDPWLQVAILADIRRPADAPSSFTMLSLNLRLQKISG